MDVTRATKVFVELLGVELWMIMQGEDNINEYNDFC